MSELVEIKFDELEEFIEAVADNKTPVFVGEITSIGTTERNTTIWEKTVKLTLLDYLDSEKKNYVVYSFIDKLPDVEVSNFPDDPERKKILDKLLVDVEDKKKGIRTYFEKKGKKVFFGIIRKYELLG